MYLRHGSQDLTRPKFSIVCWMSRADSSLLGLGENVGVDRMSDPVAALAYWWLSYIVRNNWTSLFRFRFISPTCGWLCSFSESAKRRRRTERISMSEDVSKDTYRTVNSRYKK